MMLKSLFRATLITGAISGGMVSDAFSYATKPQNPEPKAYLVVKFNRFSEGAERLRVLFGEDTLSQKLPAGSLIKNLVAYVVLQSIKDGHMFLDQVISVPKEVRKLSDSRFSKLPVDKLTVKEALVTLFGQSNNFATYSLAVAHSGSESVFIEHMERLAERLGLMDTKKIFTATGLPLKTEEGRYDTHTSPLDMMKLAAALVTDFPEFKDLMSPAKVEVGGVRLRLSRNNLGTLSFSHEFLLEKTAYLDKCSSGVVVIRDYIFLAMCASHGAARNGFLEKLYKKAESFIRDSVPSLPRDPS